MSATPKPTPGLATTLTPATHAPAIAALTSAPLTSSWADHITLTQQVTIIGLPIVALILIYVFLRCIWKVPEGNSLPKFAGPKYGSTDDKDALNKIKKEKSSLCEEGEAAGDYDAPWTQTFDLIFLLGMILYLVVLLVLTYLYAPEYFSSIDFWLFQLPKLGCMMAVSLLGGLVCRCFCEVDSKGYIMTNKSSVFKVNYTRKLQHFAAYMVPLVIHSSYHGPLALGWGDFFTMLGFLVLIKPIRESATFFMLQFNSLDRPEDRPHTLNWIIAGNIAPGLFILMFFKWLYGEQGALTFIIVFITGIGDGLAEPVGIAWGKHKYKTRSCFSSRKYTRSWEGSACVFLSGMIFPALQYANFQSFTQVLTAMLILPPTMAYAEAIAPHTMDTPVLMIGCGAILYAITHLIA
ncbi:hypothetical protein SPRG_10766 [Saprolegnia parasitica CBS 223.65]|uniref:Dolichol kinase n=1 Tax=Saprolegnia parasitica (strain CBS 223.65) TaxID=695850 RepID=A0A067CAJ8_SAPPC|nr:hypothetical protein SPRG_10766 [Saprolegnia parasitica CBS 223.65]KDO23571.1 hypothetical protein SPRG_10766 [Saprolegnia parasitica CBS 223.65]|eukprot:XP_012205720.1 hypothetical protein SPRG_10766 [Saprolegnia parasitica CBS 223.65]